MTTIAQDLALLEALESRSLAARLAAGDAPLFEGVRAILCEMVKDPRWQTASVDQAGWQALKTWDELREFDAGGSVIGTTPDRIVPKHVLNHLLEGASDEVRLRARVVWLRDCNFEKALPYTGEEHPPRVRREAWLNVTAQSLNQSQVAEAATALLRLSEALQDRSLATIANLAAGFSLAGDDWDAAFDHFEAAMEGPVPPDWYPLAISVGSPRSTALTRLRQTVWSRSPRAATMLHGLLAFATPTEAPRRHAAFSARVHEAAVRRDPAALAALLQPLVANAPALVGSHAREVLAIWPDSHVAHQYALQEAFANTRWDDVERHGAAVLQAGADAVIAVTDGPVLAAPVAPASTTPNSVAYVHTVVACAAFEHGDLPRASLHADLARRLAVHWQTLDWVDSTFDASGLEGAMKKAGQAKRSTRKARKTTKSK